MTTAVMNLKQVRRVTFFMLGVVNCVASKGPFSRARGLNFQCWSLPRIHFARLDEDFEDEEDEDDDDAASTESNEDDKAAKKRKKKHVS